MKTRVLEWLLFAAGLLVLPACANHSDSRYYGYVEGEFVDVAAPYAGQLVSLSVARGQQVEAGGQLFALERGNETAAVREAEERLNSTQARRDNLSKGLRLPELEALQAEAAQAEAARSLSATQLERSRKLSANGLLPQSELDQARAALERDTARLEQVQARIRLASESVGRTKEIAGAQSDVDAAKAVLEQARWRLDQKGMTAPASGLVHDTFFSQGEWVPAGKPIVSLLPPGNIKVRFFVPEPLIGSIVSGQNVSVNCDGCGDPIPAKISYVSTQPEYTPPVIYSRESRAKLVFMVEARPEADQAPRLKPGQPVDVRIVGP